VPGSFEVVILNETYHRGDRSLHESDDHEGEPARDVIRYELPGGWQVLAGRSDAANDRLSLRLARPADWWFHIRGMPGSHVVLRVPPGATPERAILELAAALAAYHSKARGAGTVAVSGTEARHVSKRPGAPPGTVAVRKETVLKVRPLTDAAAAALRRS
jgi:predicted ribosome quality control (RQC) complex YloA/Tae2 family protein